MDGGRTTEERLKFYLGTDQTAIERLCTALLNLDRRFSNVRPGRPLGGRDGGKDIAATFERQAEAWAAVGFRHNVTDSPADKRWAKGKFRADLERVLKGGPHVRVFVFFTNVDLTPGELTELEAHAAGKGMMRTEFFTRERMRVSLDSPEGLALRYQYLNIELSTAEQASFFARFGEDFEALVTKQQTILESRLARLEFLQSCLMPLVNVQVIIELRQPSSQSDLGHFRVKVMIVAQLAKDPIPALWICGRDDTLFFPSPDATVQHFSIRTILCSENTEHRLIEIGGYPGETVPRFEFGGHVHDIGPFRTLGDLHRRQLCVHVTKPLYGRMRSIAVIANNYLIACANVENIFLLDGGVSGQFIWRDWPEDLTEEERQVPWVELHQKSESDQRVWFRPYTSLDWSLDFDVVTPKKIG